MKIARHTVNKIRQEDYLDDIRREGKGNRNEKNAATISNNEYPPKRSIAS
jgi:hypothetical protein